MPFTLWQFEQIWSAIVLPATAGLSIRLECSRSWQAAPDSNEASRTHRDIIRASGVSRRFAQCMTRESDAKGFTDFPLRSGD